mgnify:CR=1 FL=1
MATKKKKGGGGKKRGGGKPNFSGQSTSTQSSQQFNLPPTFQNLTWGTPTLSSMQLGPQGGWNTVAPYSAPFGKKTLASTTARRANKLLNAKSPEQAERKRKKFERAWEREKWEQGREGRRAERKEEKKIKREERREALAEYYGNLPQYRTLDGNPISRTPSGPPGSGIRRSGFRMDYTKHAPRAYRENIQAYGYA